MLLNSSRSRKFSHMSIVFLITVCITGNSVYFPDKHTATSLYLVATKISNPATMSVSSSYILSQLNVLKQRNMAHKLCWQQNVSKTV